MKFLDYPSLARRGATSILVFLLSATVAHGATYYVRTDGNNANAGNSNAPAGAWRTVDFPADNVSPGDVVRVQAGTYSEIVTAGRNGSSGNTITFVADGNATVCGWNFVNSSYIRVIGFVIDSNAGCTARDRTVVLQGTNSYLELWHNTIRDGGDGIGMPSITDPRIYDFYHYHLDGPNKYEWGDWRAVNAVVEQVKKITDTQKGLIVYCPQCDTQYNVVMFRPGASIQCYKCGSPLRIPARATSQSVDESLYFGDQ